MWEKQEKPQKQPIDKKTRVKRETTQFAHAPAFHFLCMRSVNLSLSLSQSLFFQYIFVIVQCTYFTYVSMYICTNTIHKDEVMNCVEGHSILVSPITRKANLFIKHAFCNECEAFRYPTYSKINRVLQEIIILDLTLLIKYYNENLDTYYAKSLFLRGISIF